MALGKDDTGLRALLGDIYVGLHMKTEADQQYNLALGYYEKALSREEETYWIYQEMIWIAHKQRDSKKKLEYLNRASEKHEMTIWLMYHYARCYSDLGEYKKAVDACRYCKDRGEGSKEFYDLFAWNLGRSDQEECMEKYEGDDWNYGELGWNYAQIKEYEKARDCFLKALSLSKDNPQHTGMLGWCYLRMNQLDDAQQQVEKAFALGRDDGWLHSIRA
ncbi:MAG: tetratricopeptide repeat protein, partial [Longicatena sp.]